MADLKQRGPTPPGLPKKKRIGELLVAERLVEQEHIQKALDHQKEHGGKIVEILISLGYLDVLEFAKFVSKQHGVPSINLANYQVSPDLCGLIPREFAVRHEVFPIDKLGKLLTVGMVFPLDSETLDQLAKITGLRVKALLCSAVDVHTAIQQFYPPDKSGKPDAFITEEQVVTAVRLENVAKTVRLIDALPTLPQTVQKIQAAVDDPDISIKEVAAIVRTDPPVSARLLQLANSAAYGFPNRIDVVDMAATLLGLKETYRVALSCAVIDLTQASKNFDYQRFWADSAFAAIAAKVIAEACNMKHKGGVFTAGLLHDIGRFALSEAAPQKYAEIDWSLRGEALIEAELEALGIAHPEAGYLLASRWAFPDDIAVPIRFHQRPKDAQKEREIVMIVALAARMTELRHEKPDDAALHAECGEVAGEIGLDSATVFTLYERATASASELR